MLISTCWATMKMRAMVLGMARPATSSGIPAATIEAKTRMSTSGGDRQRHDLGLLEVLLGLLGAVLRDRAVAGELVAVAGRRDQVRADPIDRIDRLLVGHGQFDDDVGGVARRADEPLVAGLRVADDAGDVRVVGEAGGRLRRSRAWNSGDVASAPGVSERKSAIMLLLPEPKSSSRRAATSADSELASSQPPELRAPAVWAARTEEAMAMTTAIRATGRRKR